jgi:hypothetical protein
MKPEPKSFVSILDTQATAGETNTYKFDTLGYEYAVINVTLMGTETTDPPTVLKLEQSNDNTTFSAFTGFLGGTDFTLPTAIRTLGNASQGPTVVQMRADLRATKRYLQLTCNAATKMTQVINVNLYKGKEAPESATNANVTTLVVA